mmetsp:Transcript_3662/g.13435  ORF Transcript_3662/g.13435 Transcript_3662/m.13435 type:complete len:205 (+) Transcript_3662:6458-7072(+)
MSPPSSQSEFRDALLLDDTADSADRDDVASSLKIPPVLTAGESTALAAPPAASSAASAAPGSGKSSPPSSSSLPSPETTATTGGRNATDVDESCPAAAPGLRAPRTGLRTADIGLRTPLASGLRSPVVRETDTLRLPRPLTAPLTAPLPAPLMRSPLPAAVLIDPSLLFSEPPSAHCGSAPPPLPPRVPTPVFVHTSSPSGEYV